MGEGGKQLAREDFPKDEQELGAKEVGLLETEAKVHAKSLTPEGSYTYENSSSSVTHTASFFN